MENLYEADDDYIFMCDDDIHEIRFLMTFKSVVYDDPDHLVNVIQHTAQLALDSGAHLFGWSHTARPQERHPWVPFTFRAWVSGHAWGIVGNDIKFDELLTDTDVDYTLQHIQRDRIVVQDMRFCWVGEHFSEGGLAEFRTNANRQSTIERLKHKWGTAIIGTKSDKRQSGQSVRVMIH